MRILLVFFIAVMIFKDTFGVFYPYVLRGAVQGACLVYALYWLTINSTLAKLKDYWPILLLLLVVAFSSAISSDPIYVFLQFSALLSVVLFSLALLGNNQTLVKNYEFMIYAAITIYIVVFIASLILVIKNPSAAYEYEISVGQNRFRGMFVEPGMMANASGLVLGAALFLIRNKVIKYSVVVLAIVCLGMAMSRTNWVAAFSSICFTYFLFSKKRARFVFGIVSVLLIAVLAKEALQIEVDKKGLEKTVRADSLSTLSGRTYLWAAGIEAFMKRPVLGYGYTTGTDGLKEVDTRDSVYIDDLKREKGRIRGNYHNAYIQWLLDTGLLGVSLYLVSLLYPVLYLIRNRSANPNRMEMSVIFILVYGMVANLGKAYVYTASVYDSVNYWMVLVFAYYLVAQKKRGKAAI